jgi:hypothetical protein
MEIRIKTKDLVKKQTLKDHVYKIISREWAVFAQKFEG